MIHVCCLFVNIKFLKKYFYFIWISIKIDNTICLSLSGGREHKKMAKNKFSKFLAGVAVIGTGVAVGLTIFKKLEALNKELDEDEYEDDDDDFLSDFDEPDANDDNKEYVTINSVKASKDDTKEAYEEARDEAVEEFLKESINEELANELAENTAKEAAAELDESKEV